MPKTWLNDNNTWREATKVWVNDAGTWRDCVNVWHNDAGTWRNHLAQGLSLSSLLNAQQISAEEEGKIYTYFYSSSSNRVSFNVEQADVAVNPFDLTQGVIFGTDDDDNPTELASFQNKFMNPVARTAGSNNLDSLPTGGSGSGTREGFLLTPTWNANGVVASANRQGVDNTSGFVSVIAANGTDAANVIWTAHGLPAGAISMRAIYWGTGTSNSNHLYVFYEQRDADNDGDLHMRTLLWNVASSSFSVVSTVDLVSVPAGISTNSDQSSGICQDGLDPSKILCVWVDKALIVDISTTVATVGTTYNLNTIYNNTSSRPTNSGTGGGQSKLFIYEFVSVAGSFRGARWVNTGRGGGVSMYGGVIRLSVYQKAGYIDGSQVHGEYNVNITIRASLSNNTLPTTFRDHGLPAPFDPFNPDNAFSVASSGRVLLDAGSRFNLITLLPNYDHSMYGGDGSTDSRVYFLKMNNSTTANNEVIVHYYDNTDTLDDIVPVVFDSFTLTNGVADTSDVVQVTHTFGEGTMATTSGNPGLVRVSTINTWGQTSNHNVTGKTTTVGITYRDATITNDDGYIAILVWGA